MANPLIVLCFALAADADSIERPWGTIHADLAGTAASDEIPYEIGGGPVDAAWRLDVSGAGFGGPAGRSSIVFDRDGNLYWLSWNAGIGDSAHLASASPQGSIRWVSKNDAGKIIPVGTVPSGASPVVGGARVYAVGDFRGFLAAGAYDKETGRRLWIRDLSPSAAEADRLLTPALHEGKLYVVGLEGGKSRRLHRLDAETGILDWTSPLAGVEIAAVGQMAFVQDAGGPGEHGIFFHGDSGSAADGIFDFHAVHIADSGASVRWRTESGPAARSHVVYSARTKLLYSPMGLGEGADLRVHDPLDGAAGAHRSARSAGHGFFDVAALDFDGEGLIAGGSSGEIIRYDISRSPQVSDERLFQGGSGVEVPFWGATRVLGQLATSSEGHSVLITATGSFQCCAARVVAVDVAARRLLWEFDTGLLGDDPFQLSGGPLMGPDGKVYVFATPPQGPTELLALGLAASERPPTAGFVVLEPDGKPLGGFEGPTACAAAGETVRVDASCSTGKNLSLDLTIEPSGGVEAFPRVVSDPIAQYRFHRTGTYEVVLRARNGGGSAECRRTACVNLADPECRVSVTDMLGGQVDDRDDGDNVPCMVAGVFGYVEAGASAGGDLDYEFSAEPPGGADIEAGDSSNPRRVISFTLPGVYQVRAVVSNVLGQSECLSKQICVTPGEVSPRFRRGDSNADGAIDLSDPVFFLGSLFLGETQPGCIEACNTNRDEQADISDAIFLLDHLFLGGERPPPPYPVCGKDPEPGRLGCERAGC